MNQFNRLFRSRIGLPEGEKLTFDLLGRILEKTAQTIPFENLKVIAKDTEEITKEQLMDKVLLQKQGGLCYELNPTLYFFLQENGFDVSLVRGVVFDQQNNRWGTIGRTHVFTLLNHENARYIVDTGFGANLPLVPVPLSGETVSSSNGQFRVVKEDNPHGDYYLEIKLKHKDQDWRKGYAFNSNQFVEEISELTDVQTTICNNPESPFNKSYLINRLTANGSLTLTDNSLTRWENGKMVKEQLEASNFKQLASQHFGIH